MPVHLPPHCPSALLSFIAREPRAASLAVRGTLGTAPPPLSTPLTLPPSRCSGPGPHRLEMPSINQSPPHCHSPRPGASDPAAPTTPTSTPSPRAAVVQDLCDSKCNQYINQLINQSPPHCHSPRAVVGQDLCDLTLEYLDPPELQLSPADVPRSLWPPPRRQLAPFNEQWAHYVRAAGPGVRSCHAGCAAPRFAFLHIHLVGCGSACWPPWD